MNAEIHKLDYARGPSVLPPPNDAIGLPLTPVRELSHATNVAGVLAFIQLLFFPLVGITLGLNLLPITWLLATLLFFIAIADGFYSIVALKSLHENHRRRSAIVITLFGLVVSLAGVLIAASGSVFPFLVGVP